MMLFFQIFFVSLCIEKKKLHVKPFSPRRITDKRKHMTHMQQPRLCLCPSEQRAHELCRIECQRLANVYKGRKIYCRHVFDTKFQTMVYCSTIGDLVTSIYKY